MAALVAGATAGAAYRSEAGGLGHILIAFIRHRLSRPADPKSDDGFEDVKLALAVLGTRAVRVAQAATKQGIDLSGVNFRGISLHGVDLSEFRLAGCVFDRCQMGSAKLMRADLSGASLVGRGYDGANLAGADLSGADLSGADFTARPSQHATSTARTSRARCWSARSASSRSSSTRRSAIRTPPCPRTFRFVPVRTQRARPVDAACSRGRIGHERRILRPRDGGRSIRASSSAPERRFGISATCWPAAKSARDCVLGQNVVIGPEGTYRERMQDPEQRLGLRKA